MGRWKVKMQLYGQILLFLSVLAISSVSLAAERHVRAGATGNGSGSDWTNACPGFTGACAGSSLVRGDTYYVADGSYGSVTWSTPNSGTTKIFIKKAAIADHGSDTGWSDSFGDGTADWTNWVFSSDYWELDGQVGQWASDLPNYVQHGFRVLRNTSSDGAPVISAGTSGTDDRTDLTFRHIEAAYTNTPRQSGAWGRSQDIIAALCTNLTISRSWLHDGGRVIIINTNRHNMLVEYSVLERNGHAQVANKYSPSEHSEMVAMQVGGNDHTFRYNVVRDWTSTGGLHLMGQNHTNIRFYGNVFATTGYWASPSEANDGNGVLSKDSGATVISSFVYNNTFVDIAYGGTIESFGTGANRNNIFYNVRHCSAVGGVCTNTGATIGGTHSHNWYFSSGTQSESNIQNGTGDPFVDRAKKNYHLAAATNAGLTLSSPFGTDPDDKTRGADGIWDRGAYEFGGVTAAPNPPTSLRVL